MGFKKIYNKKLRHIITRRTTVYAALFGIMRKK